MQKDLVTQVVPSPVHLEEPLVEETEDSPFLRVGEPFHLEVVPYPVEETFLLVEPYLQVGEPCHLEVASFHQEVVPYLHRMVPFLLEVVPYHLEVDPYRLGVDPYPYHLGVDPCLQGVDPCHLVVAPCLPGVLELEQNFRQWPEIGQTHHLLSDCSYQAVAELTHGKAASGMVWLME